MMHRGRARMTPSRAQALLAVAAAALVLVASASDAFVTAQAPVQKSGLAALPARASRATPVQSQGTGFFRTAAATALMCIALSACRRSPQPKIRVHAVQCKSFAISEAQAPEVTPCASFSCDSSTSVETLLDLDAPSASCLAASPLMTEVTIQVEAPAMAMPTPASAAHGPARLVGSTRRASRRSRSARKAAATSSAKARRAVGKSLQRRVEPVPVAQRPFDPSTVRFRVQIGLRASSTVPSEKGREATSPSTFEGSHMSTGLRIQANDFREE
ncbi:unnamed protein product [Effrenium voratum]|nr:unnamed protein product [Effrenium voratum]